jgi:hypothetical protein
MHLMNTRESIPLPPLLCSHFSSVIRRLPNTKSPEYFQKQSPPPLNTPLTPTEPTRTNNVYQPIVSTSYHILLLFPFCFGVRLCGRPLLLDLFFVLMSSYVVVYFSHRIVDHLLSHQDNVPFVPFSFLVLGWHLFFLLGRLVD